MLKAKAEVAKAKVEEAELQASVLAAEMAVMRARAAKKARRTK